MRRFILTATVTAAVLGLTACGGATEPSADRFHDAIVDAHERYPDIGGVDRGDVSWRCPLVDSVEVAGQGHDQQQHTLFAKLSDGVYAVTCEFNEPLLVDLSYAEADDDQAYAALEAATGSVDQPGNEQSEESITVDGLEFVVVTTDFSNANTQLAAHHLDPATLSRMTLVVAAIDSIEGGYTADQIAADLAALIPG